MDHHWTKDNNTFIAFASDIGLRPGVVPNTFVPLPDTTRRVNQEQWLIKINEENETESWETQVGDNKYIIYND